MNEWMNDKESTKINWVLCLEGIGVVSISFWKLSLGLACKEDDALGQLEGNTFM